MTELIIREKIPSWNTFHSRAHWTKRKEVSDYWHKLIYWSCYEAKIPKFKKLWIVIESQSKRPLDPDNICAKVIIDGLVQAKIIENDTPEFVKGVLLISKKSKEEITKVILLKELQGYIN